MPFKLALSSFAGSTPRRASHLVDKNHAVKALDCRLWHGTLGSWREPKQVMSVGAGTKSIYQALNCEWLESSECASWAEGSVEQRHVFATGYNGYAYPVRIVKDADGGTNVYRLGLPEPTGVLVAQAPTVLSKASAPRQYVIQYEDSFGNLSAASMPSNQVVVADGGSVQLSGWSVPSGGWDIAYIRVYRTVAGYESIIKEGENKIDSAWLLVDRIPAASASYFDRRWNIDLVEALREDIVIPPPEGLRGITWIQSMNCLAGFKGRRLYFSENNNYHNWLHSLTLDDNIKAIVESNDTIYVATDGCPYVVSGAPENNMASTRKALRMPEALPIVGGGFRSMVAVPSGAVYPTHEGLVYMSGNRTPSIITAGLYAPDDWQKLHPDTFKLAYHMGRIFAFARKGAFCLSLKDGANTNTELDIHTELSLRPDELLVTRSGRFLLRFGTEVKEWDKGFALIPHEYESVHATIGVPLTLGAFQIRMDSGEETVEVLCDGDSVLLEEVNTSDYFTLPLWATGQEFKIKLKGTAEVKMVSIATSVKEL